MLAILENSGGVFYKINDPYQTLSLNEIKYINKIIIKQNDKEDYPIDPIRMDAMRLEAIARTLEFLPD